jgi:hypothetical protein
MKKGGKNEKRQPMPVFLDACQKAFKENKFPKLKEKIEKVLKDDAYGPDAMNG